MRKVYEKCRKDISYCITMEATSSGSYLFDEEA
jgi:hypothetical protein